MDSFLDALPGFLRQFPDYRELDSVDAIRDKSRILHLGMDLRQFDDHRIDHGDAPLILWNHRWEYDKNPNDFFGVLERVKEYGYDFKLAVMGENFSQYPDIFLDAHKSFENQIVQWGFTESFSDYAQWLWKADILPVTSNQEFFGASVMEAMYCDTWPILPNRLTYPELLPPDQHKDHLYSDDQDLFNKIIWAIENHEKIKATHFHPIAQPFDWASMAPMYDNAMEQV
jgi:glycosyltransferase involved in cell wall biosynthesis